MSFIPIILGVVIGVPLSIYLGKTFIDNNNRTAKAYKHLIGTSFYDAEYKHKNIEFIEHQHGYAPLYNHHLYIQSRIHVETDSNHIITKIISCG